MKSDIFKVTKQTKCGYNYQTTQNSVTPHLALDINLTQDKEKQTYKPETQRHIPKGQTCLHHAVQLLQNQQEVLGSVQYI